jgi:hypothetical protein
MGSPTAAPMFGVALLILAGAVVGPTQDLPFSRAGANPGPTPLPTLLEPSPSPSPSEGPPPPPGFPSATVRTKITIRHDSDRGTFEGRVSSKRARCERDRRVLVRRVRSGNDKTIGRTTTPRTGRWVLTGFPDPPGRYYARTPQKEVTTDNGMVVCRAAHSETIRPRE